MRRLASEVGDAGQQPTVTVAVPVRDRRERMLRCLEAILAQDYPSFEVLVLDNGSSDGTPEACRERGARAEVSVRVEHVEGLVGRVRNEAIRLARGEILAFTDSDCVPARGWLTAGVKEFEDPSVGVVTGPTLPEDPPPYGPWYATLEIKASTWRFETSNALYRLPALRASDGFDETLGAMWEDTAVGWAVLRGGWKAGFASESVVHHDVTYPGYWWHVRRVRRYGAGPHVVRSYPELRRRVLWGRYFQSPRSASVAGAALGTLCAPLSPWGVALALPYLWRRRPRGMSWQHLHGLTQLVLLDVAELETMVRGSLRARRLML